MSEKFAHVGKETRPTRLPYGSSFINLSPQQFIANWDLVAAYRINHIAVMGIELHEEILFQSTRVNNRHILFNTGTETGGVEGSVIRFKVNHRGSFPEH